MYTHTCTHVHMQSEEGEVTEEDLHPSLVVVGGEDDSKEGYPDTKDLRNSALLRSIEKLEDADDDSSIASADVAVLDAAGEADINHNGVCKLFYSTCTVLNYNMHLYIPCLTHLAHADQLRTCKYVSKDPDRNTRNLQVKKIT